MMISGVMPAGLMLLLVPAGFRLGRSTRWMMPDTEKGICTEADFRTGGRCGGNVRAKRDRDCESRESNRKDGRRAFMDF